jgi:hypothetical protein
MGQFSTLRIAELLGRPILRPVRGQFTFQQNCSSPTPCGQMLFARQNGHRHIMIYPFLLPLTAQCGYLLIHELAMAMAKASCDDHRGKTTTTQTTHKQYTHKCCCFGFCLFLVLCCCWCVLFVLCCVRVCLCLCLLARFNEQQTGIGYESRAVIRRGVTELQIAS